MENKKSKFLVMVFVLTLCLISGCRINTTRNQYYGCPDKSKSSNYKEAGSNHVMDTLTIKKNG